VTPVAGTTAPTLAPLKLLSPAAPPAKSAKSATAELPKLVKAAGEFESMLLESLWKSMKETFTDPNEGDADPTVQSFDDWGIQSMASAVGSAGGLGIKSMIVKYLEPTLSAGAAGGTSDK